MGNSDAGTVLGPFSVAGRSAFVTVEATAEALHDTLARALAPFAGDGLRLDGDGKGPCEVRLRVRADDRGYVVARKRAVMHEGLADGEVPSRLFDIFDEVARGACARRLLGCPGAVVASEGRALLLVGDRGEAEQAASGLVATGWDLVSAAWVLLDPDGGLVAHPRPLGEGTPAASSSAATPAAVALLGENGDSPRAVGPTEGVAGLLSRSDEVARSAASLSAAAPLARDAVFVAVPAGQSVEPSLAREWLGESAPQAAGAPAPAVERGDRDADNGVEVPDRVVSLLLSDGALVHDPRTGGLHRFDAAAAILWDGILDGLTEDAILAELAPHVGDADHERVASDVAQFYAWAREEGLVAEPVGSPR